MGQKLFEFFSKKFDQNFNGCTPQDAFEKTNQELGFTAYSNYDSFDRARRKNKKKR